MGSENGTHWGNNEFVRLNRFLVLDTNIRRGPAGVDVYKMTLSEATRGEIVVMRNIMISADAEESVDVLKCPDASSEQVEAARSRRK